MSMHAVTIREEGDKVLVIFGDRALLIPPEAAKMIATELQSKAQIILNRANPELQAYDQALLLRTGIPIDITTDKRIFEMARNEAVNNREIRKNVPANFQVLNESKIGRPSFVPGKTIVRK